MITNTFIFDMDGVIIDSEPFWRQAQIELLAAHNVTISIADCIEHSMGKRIDDIAFTWCKLHELDIKPTDLEQEIIAAVASLISTSGTPKKGLHELLTYLKQENYKIALATSSSQPIIQAVFKRLSIAHYFDVVCSADEEIYGKPHPAVYLKVAHKLNVQPANCLVLEDSVTGLLAAKAASMIAIVIPEDPSDPRFSIANHIFDSMLTVVTYLKQGL